MDNLTTDTTQKKKLLFPILALLFNLSPFAMVLLSRVPIFYGFSSFFLLGLIISPFIGLIIGVLALKQGKTVIGTLGMVLSIISIIIPLALICIILVVSIGLATGMLSLM